jgi:protein-L-isoaspartate(D-aspartate) O-methyltransferase
VSPQNRLRLSALLVLAHLAREIVTIEVIDKLREHAAALLAELGYDNFTALAADDDLGAPSIGPYDVIAAATTIPPSLIENLTVGDRIAISVGTLWSQKLIGATLINHGIERVSLGGCRFVPLVGPHGFEA